MGKSDNPNNCATCRHKQQRPSDAEIIELMRDGYNCRYNDEADHIEFARAVLAKWAAPQQEAKEPVMIYHGRCTIDCGEHGHHDMEMLRMIPSGSKLYTAPQPAPAPLSERDAFERDWEKRHAPVPINVRTHDDGRYGDSSIQDAWESWQARAALAAQGGKDA